MTKYAAISLNFDSLGEAYGFPNNYHDISFTTVADRFMALANKMDFKYSIYVIGKDLERPENQAAVKQWADAGHEIGNHSWSHHTNLGGMSYADIQQEIERSHQLITNTIGYEPNGFMAPNWSTSRAALNVLNDLNYIHDTSTFPSWLMFPILAKIGLNHLSSREKFARLFQRKDYKDFLFAPRTPYMHKNICVMPMPTNQFRIGCWHTTAFMFGWQAHQKLLQDCLNELDIFYYLVHPADLIDRNDLDPNRSIHLERLNQPLARKQQYLEQALTIIKNSGRTLITMNELAEHARKRF